MSLSGPPAPKRPRTEEDTIVRSEIWYKDGSIVLQAGNTQFRVHFGLLAAHSTVFSDMYEMPQPEAQATMVDGCPLVEVQDDPEDVKNLLLVLYTPTLLSQTPVAFCIVTALVRLGSKYDFRELLTAAIQRLHLQFPSTLEEFSTYVPQLPQLCPGAPQETAELRQPRPLLLSSRVIQRRPIQIACRPAVSFMPEADRRLDRGG
ncbi:BTB domain-containing protein [Mycena indigotica]|uniref:BTB domain-containing protein n=1 Tax=Mycena indigotica TaxID=2126181 RepID=A0A8H6WK02_9AGAR|nr:BTB domain-containing protein [Mycena indigotica]KAF7315159.1 BTB domain-containing protein [Mycena indigotica]